MSTLIILGNTNQFTFANSIIAANSKAGELFNEFTKDIFIIHSSASYRALSEKTEWINYLGKYKISLENLTHRVIDLDTTPEAIGKFVSYMEFIVNGVLSNKPNLIVDLTNSTSLYKNLLSTAAYILGLEHQYLTDIVKISELTNDRGFLSLEILQKTYIPVPDATQLDNIAYLSLSEMVRYRKVIQKHTEKYLQIEPTNSDKKFFEDNLTHSIQLKIQGDQKKDNAIYRIAASSISASVEDLITIMIGKYIWTTDPTGETKKTFGQKLELIQTRMEGKTPSSFDFEFFKKFNDFMLYLRNSSTHKGATLADIERFKADLSVKMSFPFIEFYTDIIHPILANGDYTDAPKRIKKLLTSDVKSGDIFYFGLDGDNTGAVLEDLFLLAHDESMFKKMSGSVVAAIQALSNDIKNNFVGSHIVFAAGDDILFKAIFDEENLHKLQKKYKELTKGLTCSIGYGKSFREAYLALKLAKLEAGKNSIMGVELV